MIKSFADKNTHALWQGQLPSQFAPFSKVALRKLDMLNAAIELTDLLVPPGNRLEALKDKRKGQHSIRINDQWRICFVWSNGEADQVEIVDYH